MSRRAIAAFAVSAMLVTATAAAAPIRRAMHHLQPSAIRPTATRSPDAASGASPIASPTAAPAPLIQGNSSGDLQAVLVILTELNHKLAREIATLEALPKGGFDEGQVSRTLKDLEATKLSAAAQFPDVFGLPYTETFTNLSCIDEQISRSMLVLRQFESGTLKAGVYAGVYAHKFFVESLKNAKQCKDTLETELQGTSPTPTPSASPTPSPTSPPGPGTTPTPTPTAGFGVNLHGGWIHNSPGNSTIYGCVTTTPPQPGASYAYDESSSDGSQSDSEVGNLDSNGAATLQTPITQFGTYDEDITVTDSNGSETASTTVTVTSSQGTGCG
jgi:hypothetical protein